jgi:hypothetical protein
MWQFPSNPTIADPVETQSIPSRHGIAQQAYLDKKRTQADSVSIRFRWARRLIFTG